MYYQAKPNLHIVSSAYHSRCDNKKRGMASRSKTQFKKLSVCFQKTIKSLDEIARDDVKYAKELFEIVDVTFEDQQDDPFDV